MINIQMIIQFICENNTILSITDEYFNIYTNDVVNVMKFQYLLHKSKQKNETLVFQLKSHFNNYFNNILLYTL